MGCPLRGLGPTGHLTMLVNTKAWRCWPLPGTLWGLVGWVPGPVHSGMKTWVRAAGSQAGNLQAAQAGGHAALTGQQNSSVKGGCVFSRIQLFATPGAVAHQAPLSTGLFRQEYWSGLPFPSPGDLPNPGLKPESLASLAWQEDSLWLRQQKALKAGTSVDLRITRGNEEQVLRLVSQSFKDSIVSAVLSDKAGRGEAG